MKKLQIFATLLLVASGFSAAAAQETVAVLEKPATADTKPAPSAPAHVKQGAIDVEFDAAENGVVYIEVNGERVRVDVNKKTVTSLVAKAPAVVPDSAATRAATDSKTPAPATTAGAKKDDDAESVYDFDEGDEPFDYKIVNVPTPKKVPKGTWNMFFSHRFSQPLHPLSESAKNLFGFDSFSASSFGISYGITDKLYVSASRSPICQRGLCRTIEVGLGYNWFAMSAKKPFALTTYASIEGNDNFTEEYTYNIQTMLSARLGKRVHLFFSPAVHLNANGQHRFNPRPEEFFPPAAAARTFKLPTNGASFGFGTSVLITHDIAALFDFAPRVGFKLGQVNAIFDRNFNVVGFENKSYPAIGFGVQKNIGRHSFALTFSNTQTSTTSRYNSSNLVLKPRRLTIGFNLSRRF